VVGIDLPFEEPKNPDLILNNDGSMILEEQIALLKEKFSYVYDQYKSTNFM